MQQDSENGLTDEVNPEVAELEDIEELKQALAEEKEKARGYLANWQRAEADFINYKQRSEQEKEEVSKMAASLIVLNILPILDDLERAFASVPPRRAKHGWMDGIRLMAHVGENDLVGYQVPDVDSAGVPARKRHLGACGGPEAAYHNAS